MQYRLFLAISATACLIGAGFAVAEEVGNGSKAAGVQTDITTTTENPSEPIVDDTAVQPRGGGNVEWRRSDHSAPNPSRSAGASNRNGSDSSGGGSDDSGGGGVGSTD